MTREERMQQIAAIELKILPDGREVSLVPMIFNTRMCIGEPDSPILDDAYCYATRDQAIEAFHAWDGDGEPDGWIKHVQSRRFRPDGDPSNEYVQR